MVNQKPVLDSKRSRPWPASRKGPHRGLGADFTGPPGLPLPTIRNSGLQYRLTMRLFQFWFQVTIDTPVAYHMGDIHNKRPLIYVLSYKGLLIIYYIIQARLSEESRLAHAI
jgi:hypothetical protein